MADPTKQDIAAIFKKLRSIPTNKICFDCQANNPTWSSVTYGVFLCIDCSATHRSLGVHLSFVRSTQLDTNWTWHQLRCMQAGGNAHAEQFFRQHGCTTNDAKMKYNSRAATLYKDKLHGLASAAMRKYGTQLHIDTHGHMHEPTSPEHKEVDFFDEHVNGTKVAPVSPAAPSLVGSALSTPIQMPTNGKKAEETEDADGRAPDVHAALSMSPTAAKLTAAALTPTPEAALLSGHRLDSESHKPTIGTRKPASAKKTKSGLGAKKGGLGAQKVKKDFKSIEKQALEQDKLKAEMDAQVKKEESKETPMVQSMRLAYQDMNMSKNMKQQEEKLKASDPRKAKQAERLGMGIAGTRSGVSHSVQEMKVIDQVTPVSSSRKERDRDDFDSFDDFASSYTSGPPKYNDNPFRDRGRDRGNYGDDGLGDLKWEKIDRKREDDFAPSREREDMTQEEWQSELDERTSRRKEPVGMSYSETDAAQTKFANAKSISSDQFFGREKPEFEVQQRLDRFSGNQSISSADLFGEDRPRQSSRSAADMAGPDLSQLKEGVKSTAARMATLVNGVVNTIQDKYGS
ncbi:ADP-ribosylation factor GTPase-activating protein 2-like isoform X1 [Branchiostoma floridae x Branchiostoma japonicum]